MESRGAATCALRRDSEHWPFNRVGLNFSPSAAPFAVDDIVYKTPPAIPEPGTLLLVKSKSRACWPLAVGS
ncbi:MAG: hypothetical protein JWQ49_5316 [Edaphobacter sp.]|nr:hypothetical protein [Edaphobacter sp.]